MWLSRDGIGRTNPAGEFMKGNDETFRGGEYMCYLDCGERYIITYPTLPVRPQREGGGKVNEISVDSPNKEKQKLAIVSRRHLHLADSKGS